MKNKTLLLDGAMGSYLIQKGFHPPFEDLSFTHPNIIKEIHQEYIEAGAEVILTHTFNAQTLEQCEAAWNIVKDLPVKKLISLGPEANSEIIVDFFQDKGDGFIFETLYDLHRAKKIMTKYHHLDPIFSFCLRPDDFKMALDYLSQYTVTTVGLNCLDGFDEAEKLLELIPSQYQIYFKPNAGKNNLTPEEFSLKASQLIAKYSISYFGGCCGTTPAHIEKVRRTF